MRSFTLLLSFLVVFSLGQSNAQVRIPQPSPGAKLEQKVALSTITIDYSRPSAKGRKIFGDVVPFNTMWRTGANSSTKFTIDTDVKISDKNLPKGTYSLLTIPGEKEWTVIFYKNTSFNGMPAADYKPSEDAVNIKVPSYKLNDKVETFTIEMTDITNTSASLTISWENTLVKVPMAFNIDTEIEASIKKAMEGASGSDYLSAARYYFENGKDNKKALEWINTAIQKDGERFWVLKTKAEIQAALGDKKGAIETANKSMALAKEASNADYVKMNEKNIKDWSAK